MNPAYLAAAQAKKTDLAGACVNIKKRNYYAWRLIWCLDDTGITHSRLYSWLMLYALGKMLEEGWKGGCLEKSVLLALNEAIRPFPVGSDRHALRAAYCGKSKRDWKQHYAKPYEVIFSELREWSNAADRMVWRQSG